MFLYGMRALAQGNYEIQVYGADTVAPKTTMVELHSNYTAVGHRYTDDRTFPTNHQEHESIEITQGINFLVRGWFLHLHKHSGWPWNPVGLEITSVHGYVCQIRGIGPVGVSLSTEIGYQRPQYSPDTWTWEIRPIVDKSVGRWYFAGESCR